MNRKLGSVFAGLCALAMVVVGAAPARAQMSAAKEKPPMYSYVGNWTIPRAQWAEMEKSIAGNQPTLNKALADGTIVGYGDDRALVHQPDGETHDDWWSAMSMVGLLNVLEQFYKSSSTNPPVLASATKHWDAIYVSRYYNWRSGSWKDAYTRGSYYRLKADAPADAVGALSKNLLVPLMEKLLADGTIVEYEIDTEVVHTEAPSGFWLFYIAPNAAGLDKASAARQEAVQANPLGFAAFGSMTDSTVHRDILSRTNVTYK